MPFFVIPDSWGTYGIKKASSALKRAGRVGPKIGIKSGPTTTYSYKFKNLVLDYNELRVYLNTPRGPLWSYLDKRGKMAVAGAKASVGVKTGALQRSIHMRHLGNSTGQYLWIGSKLHYAYAHHEGTKPHVITSKPGGKLVFVGKGKVLVHTPVVRHPGTRPNRYLSSQLRHFLK